MKDDKKEELCLSVGKEKDLWKAKIIPEKR